MLKKKVYVHMHQKRYINIHRNIIHNIQEWETTQMPISRRQDKQCAFVQQTTIKQQKWRNLYLYSHVKKISQI